LLPDRSGNRKTGDGNQTRQDRPRLRVRAHVHTVARLPWLPTGRHSHSESLRPRPQGARPGLVLETADKRSEERRAGNDCTSSKRDCSSDVCSSDLCYLIDQGIEKLETGIKQGRIDHVSVFALTYIPWLVYLGSRLDDTLTVRVFDHDRKGRDRAWCWKQPTRPPVSWVFEVNGGGPLVDSVGWLHSVTAGVGWPGFG